MAPTDSVSVFAEGTFEEQVRYKDFVAEMIFIFLQIQELVNYIVRNRAEDDRAAFIRPFQDALKVGEGQKAIDEDEEKRRKVCSMVIAEVHGLGDGTEKGVLFSSDQEGQ